MDRGLSSADEEVLDKAVTDELDDVLENDLTKDGGFIMLLITIVKHSKGVLDDKYSAVSMAKGLFRNNGELLRGKLTEAWKNKKFGEIRKLDVLQPTNVMVKNTSFLQAQLQQSLLESFRQRYRGVASLGFLEYLSANEHEFRTKLDPSYYARFCSIVQSSGTGKSRMVTELVKHDIVVIYMNLRGETDNFSFPVRDDIPSNILTYFPGNASNYEATCYTFFTALFDALSESFSEINGKADLMEWAEKMVNMDSQVETRAEFLREVGKKYNDYIRPILDTRGVASDAFKGVSVDQTANELGQMSLSTSTQGEPPKALPPIVVRLHASYERMVSQLVHIFSTQSSGNSNPHRPKLVIAFDEAHSLAEVKGQGRDAYKPADTLGRVINSYSHSGLRKHAVWVVFASTTSNVSDFTPPNHEHNSDRIARRGEMLFPPYTQLGWDQRAKAFLSNADMENVSKAKMIAGFGRPLWYSLKEVKQPIGMTLDLAQYKLCPGGFYPNKSNHVLAVLGQRFALNVAFGHPDSVEHLETGIASHMRVCLGTTPDRIWRFTDYPSEPFLSCAAALILHSGPTSLSSALTTLSKEVNRGMINKGHRGELASRLLWLLAKDLFIRTDGKNLVLDFPSEWGDHLADCQMIPVVDWLEFVFGKGIWAMDKCKGAREAFKDAYVNFSHWVCMEVNIAGSRKHKEIGLSEWTQRHWQRTSAIQCCHQQPLIDKVIPIYFKDRSSDRPRMSQILISDKAKSGDSKPTLNYINRKKASIGGSKSMNGPPYIAILADLGVPKPQVTATYNLPSCDSDAVLRIYAAGVHTKTYRFLNSYEALRKALQDLAQIPENPGHEDIFRKYLDDQFRFGSTPTASHMHWESGAKSPDSMGGADSGSSKADDDESALGSKEEGADDDEEPELEGSEEGTNDDERPDLGSEEEGTDDEEPELEGSEEGADDDEETDLDPVQEGTDDVEESDSEGSEE